MIGALQRIVRERARGIAQIINLLAKVFLLSFHSQFLVKVVEFILSFCVCFLESAIKIKIQSNIILYAKKKPSE